MSYTQEKEFDGGAAKEGMCQNEDLGCECKFERSVLPKQQSENNLKKKQDRLCTKFGITSFPVINVDVGKGVLYMKGQTCDIRHGQGQNHHGSTIQIENEAARKIAELDKEYLMRNFPVSYFENVDLLFKIISKKKKFIKDTYKTDKKEKSKENVVSLQHTDCKKLSVDILPSQKPVHRQKIMKIKTGKIEGKEDAKTQGQSRRMTQRYKQIITQHHEAKPSNRSMQKVFSQRKSKRSNEKQPSYQEKIREITDNRNTIHSHAKSAQKFRIKHVDLEVKGNSPDEFIKTITSNPNCINTAKEKPSIQKKNIKLNTQIAFPREKRRDADKKSKTNIHQERKFLQVQQQLINKDRILPYRKSEEVQQRLYPNNRTLNSEHTDGNGLCTQPASNYFQNENQTEVDFDEEEDKKTIKIGDDVQSENGEKPIFIKPIIVKAKDIDTKIMKKQNSYDKNQKKMSPRPYQIQKRKEQTPRNQQQKKAFTRNIKRITKSPENNYPSQQKNLKKNSPKVQTKESAQLKINDIFSSPTPKESEVQSINNLVSADFPSQRSKTQYQEICSQTREAKQLHKDSHLAQIIDNNERVVPQKQQTPYISPIPITNKVQQIKNEVHIKQDQNESFLKSQKQQKKQVSIHQQSPDLPHSQTLKGSLVAVENLQSSSSSYEVEDDLKKTPRFNNSQPIKKYKGKRSTKRFDTVRSSEEATIAQPLPSDPSQNITKQPIIQTEQGKENLQNTFFPSQQTYHCESTLNKHQKQRIEDYKVHDRSQRTYSNIDSEEINNFYDEIVQLGVNEIHQYHPKIGRKSNISAERIQQARQALNAQQNGQQHVVKRQQNKPTSMNSIHSIDKAIMVYTESDNLINNSCEQNIVPRLSKKPSSKISIFSSTSQAQKIQNHAGKKKPTTIIEQQEEHLMYQTKPMNLNSSLICIDLNQNANVPPVQPVIEAERPVFQVSQGADILKTTETKQYNEDYCISVNKIKENVQERQERSSAEPFKRIASSSACIQIPINNQRSKEASVIGNVSQTSLLHLDAQEEAEINRHLQGLKKCPSKCLEVEENILIPNKQVEQYREFSPIDVIQGQKINEQVYDLIRTDKSFEDEIIKKRGSQIIVNSLIKLSKNSVENMKGSKSMKKLSLNFVEQPLNELKNDQNKIKFSQSNLNEKEEIQNAQMSKQCEDELLAEIPCKIVPTYSEFITENVEKDTRLVENQTILQEKEILEEELQIKDQKQAIIAKAKQDLRSQEEKISNKFVVKSERQSSTPTPAPAPTPILVESSQVQRQSQLQKEDVFPLIQQKQQDNLQKNQELFGRHSQKIETLPVSLSSDLNNEVPSNKIQLQQLQNRQQEQSQKIKEIALKEQKTNVRRNIQMHKMFEINIMNQLGTNYQKSQQNSQQIFQVNHPLIKRKSHPKISSLKNAIQKRNIDTIISQQVANQKENQVQQCKNILSSETQKILQDEKKKRITVNDKTQEEIEKNSQSKNSQEILLGKKQLEIFDPQEVKQQSTNYLQSLLSKVQYEMRIKQTSASQIDNQSQFQQIQKNRQRKNTYNQIKTDIAHEQKQRMESPESGQQRFSKIIEPTQKRKQQICVPQQQYIFSDESHSESHSQKQIAALPLSQSPQSETIVSNTQRSSMQKVKLTLEEPSHINFEEQRIEVSKKDFSTNTNDMLARFQEKAEDNTVQKESLAEISKYILDFDSKQILKLKKNDEFVFNQQIWTMILKIFAFLDAKDAYFDRLIDKESVWLFNCLQKQSKFHRYAIPDIQVSNKQNIKQALKQLVIKLSQKIDIDQKNIKFFIETLTGMPVLLLKQTCYHKLDNLYRHSNIFGFTFGKGQVWRIVGTLLNKKNQQEKRLRLEKLSNNQIIEITWKKFLEEFKYSFIAGFSQDYHLKTLKITSNFNTKSEERPSFKLTVKDEGSNGKKVHCLMGITSHKELGKQINGKMLVYGKTQSEKKGEQCYKYLGSGDIGLVSMKLKKGEYIIVLQIQQRNGNSELQLLMGSESSQVVLRHQKS